MANTKISALTSATTPLAGTEVLPIVQSGVTVKVANNDLRPKQIQSNATSGVMQIVGPAAAATRVMTIPDANFTVARTDAANSFTGDQTLSTGNLIQGTASKGINFTANSAAAGMTSQLFNYYEEGTFTPTYTTSNGAFASVTYGFQNGKYVRIGKMVYITLSMRTTAANITGATGLLQVAGLPFTAATQSLGAASMNVSYASIFANVRPMGAYVASGGTVMYLTYISNPVGSNWVELNATELSTANPANQLLLTGSYIAA
tara:strand:- start:17454 stop:18236 length:783 start_codon:yes stop_codon:yes gene_type:complete